MTPYQLAAFQRPCLVPADFNRPDGPGIVGATTHWERGFRVTMIVDAVPESAGKAEQWAAWHIQVVLWGELAAVRRRDKGKGHVARPLGAWGGLREKGALHILRRELAGVGEPDSERIVGKAQAIAHWLDYRKRHPVATEQAPVGVYGRRRMTQDEAEACFATQREVLARLNPTYALLHQLEDVG